MAVSVCSNKLLFNQHFFKITIIPNISTITARTTVTTRATSTTFTTNNPGTTCYSNSPCTAADSNVIITTIAPPNINAAITSIAPVI